MSSWGVSIVPVVLCLASCGEDHASKAASPAPAASTSSGSLDARALEVGCAMCVFHMPGSDTCELAAKIDGVPYLVSGVEMPGHETGLCDYSRTAEITGTIEGGRVVAKSFTLRP